ncbi:hypothetical protein MSAN_01100600 [Mycena sanguinolenta]|uniref:Uncharacterized protein n=1 Tax=Mycena sanguinolenta TaxID=230812 RepID=A0A8H6YTK5_9AGAR|nr:hypothetical protein MSAN_01100600 [Mycena sanguinolenta]
MSTKTTNRIQLKTWLPTDTKPSWDWKAKDSPELANFSIAFAVREYVQNITDQILKDLKVREWRDWSREDFRHKTTSERTARKHSLEETYPGLFTGPHGLLLRSQNYLPLYILSARVAIQGKTNFMAAIVVWSTDSSRNALSFFNNHLDDHASFESFVVDGKSTKKHDQWTVGKKGRGFILATQYLAEHIPDAGKQSGPSVSFGISFRIGEQVGELKWKTSPTVGSEPLLRVILDDLTTRTLQEYLAHRYLIDVGNAVDGGQPDSYDRTLETSVMREEARLILKQVAKRRMLWGMDGPDAKSVVKSDEVCITIIGIAQRESDPEYLFSSIYGIIPPSFQWRIPNSPVEFFLHGKTPRFYHRDQLVPHGLHLNKVSINYHGDLILSSDRAMVQTDPTHVSEYRDALRSAIHWAFQTLPYLAIELANDILTDDHSDGFAGILTPPDKDAAAQYRTAFETVWRRQITTPLELHPSTRTETNLSLFAQLGLEPVMVSPRVLDFLYQSGAYLPIAVYAGKLLLESPPVPDFGGLGRIRSALRTLLPTLASENISVRQYSHRYPSVVLDEQHKLVAFAQPQPCEDHSSKECLCPIGPGLQDMVKEHTGTAISIGRIWRALGVEGAEDTTIERSVSITPRETSNSSSSNPNMSPQPTAIPGSATQGSTSEYNRPVVIPKPPYRTAVENVPRATDNQANALSTVTQLRLLSNSADSPSAQPLPPPDNGEAAANISALAQFSKFAVGFNLVQRYNEIANNLDVHRRALEAKELDIRTSITEKDQTIAERDARIAALEEDNKRLSEDLAEEEEVAIAAAERAKKRRKTA